MKLKRFDLYCDGHIAEDRDECEDGEYVDATEAFQEIERLHNELKLQNPVGWLGINPRNNIPEFSFDMPSPSVMRDFNVRPLYAAPVSNQDNKIEQLCDELKSQNAELLQALETIIFRCKYVCKYHSAHEAAMKVITKVRGEA